MEKSEFDPVEEQKRLDERLLGVPFAVGLHIVSLSTCSSPEGPLPWKCRRETEFRVQTFSPFAVGGVIWILIMFLRNTYFQDNLFPIGIGQIASEGTQRHRTTHSELMGHWRAICIWGRLELDLRLGQCQTLLLMIPQGPVLKREKLILFSFFLLLYFLKRICLIFTKNKYYSLCKSPDGELLLLFHICCGCPLAEGTFHRLLPPELFWEGDNFLFSEFRLDMDRLFWVVATAAW